MNKQIFDVDIDVAPNVERDRFGVRAMIYDAERDTIRPHPSGVYLDENTPIDPESGLCPIPYNRADKEYGLFKIDLLTNTAYGLFAQEGATKQDVLDCYHREPNWKKLLDDRYLDQLPHIKSHKELVRRVQPQSIHDLADLLALIRPGKAHLVEDYCRGEREKKRVRAKLYKRPAGNDKVYFKKSHSYAYAAMIIVVFNRLCEQEFFTIS